jgi:hypothetical protein
MVIMREFFALLAGFAVMAAVVMVVTALLRQLAPDWVALESRPQPGYVFVNFGCSFLAAAAGGYITAWAAGANPLADLLALAVVVLVLGAISALQARGRQPAWYQIMLLILSPMGVVAGGLVRLRVVGIL